MFFLSRYTILLFLVVCLNLSSWGLLGWIKTCKNIYESFPLSGLGRFNLSTKIHIFEENWENPDLFDGFWDRGSLSEFWVLMLLGYPLNTLWTPLQSLSSIGVDLNQLWIFEENSCRLIHTGPVQFDGPVCTDLVCYFRPCVLSSVLGETFPKVFWACV